MNATARILASNLYLVSYFVFEYFWETSILTLENRQLTEEGKSLEKNRAEQTHFCTLGGGKKGRFHAHILE